MIAVGFLIVAVLLKRRSNEKRPPPHSLSFYTPKISRRRLYHSFLSHQNLTLTQTYPHRFTPPSDNIMAETDVGNVNAKEKRSPKRLILLIGAIAVAAAAVFLNTQNSSIFDFTGKICNCRKVRYLSFKLV